MGAKRVRAPRDTTERSILIREGLAVADMVLVLCILMSAYFIRGITGFGSGLISVPLLALSQPLHFAIPLVLALDFTASVILGSTNNKKANWAEIRSEEHTSELQSRRDL